MRSLYNRLLYFAEKFFNVVLVPNFCALCHQFLHDTFLLCHSCFKNMQPVAPKTVAITKNRAYIVHALSLYKEELKPLIHAKFYGNHALCQELGLLTYLHATVCNTDFDIIVPIPLHWTRYARRGFNQAEEMAKAMSKQSGKPIIHFLKRVRKTKYQSLLKKEERPENVRSAFQIALSVQDYKKYKNMRVLLVDDLFTTGSTVEEAIKALDVSSTVHVLVAFRV